MATTTKPVVEVPTKALLGVPVSTLDMGGTMEAIGRILAQEQPTLLATADASGIVLAQSDPGLMQAYRSAGIVTPDSQGVVWALRRNGAPVKERVSGVDLVDKVCALSANKGHRIFLLGAAPGVAELAAERLRLKHPGCNIVGTRHGYFPPDDDLLVAQEVAASKPDVLLVAMGIPRQEKFILLTGETIGFKLAIGVGGSLDVFSGRVKRAPVVVQKLRLEWLWRTLLNPSKLSKAKLLPTFVRLVLRSPK